MMTIRKVKMKRMNQRIWEGKEDEIMRLFWMMMTE